MKRIALITAVLALALPAYASACTGTNAFGEPWDGSWSPPQGFTLQAVSEGGQRYVEGSAYNTYDRMYETLSGQRVELRMQSMAVYRVGHPFESFLGMVRTTNEPAMTFDQRWGPVAPGEYSATLTDAYAREDCFFPSAPYTVMSNTVGVK